MATVDKLKNIEGIENKSSIQLKYFNIQENHIVPIEKKMTHVDKVTNKYLELGYNKTGKKRVIRCYDSTDDDDDDDQTLFVQASESCVKLTKFQKEVLERLRELLKQQTVLAEQHSAELSQLREEHSAELLKLREEHSADLLKLRQDQSALVEQYSQETLQLRQELSQLRREYTELREEYGQLVTSNYQQFTELKRQVADFSLEVNQLARNYNQDQQAIDFNSLNIQSGELCQRLANFQNNLETLQKQSVENFQEFKVELLRTLQTELSGINLQFKTLRADHDNLRLQFEILKQRLDNNG